MMNASRDSYVEDNYDQVLEAFKHCGWQAVTSSRRRMGCQTNVTHPFHEPFMRQRQGPMRMTTRLGARYYGCW